MAWESRKCLLLQSNPKVAPVQVWGCTRARDIFGTPGPSPKKTTCSFSYRFRGSSGNSGVVPGSQGRKVIFCIFIKVKVASKTDLNSGNQDNFQIYFCLKSFLGYPPLNSTPLFLHPVLVCHCAPLSGPLSRDRPEKRRCDRYSDTL